MPWDWKRVWVESSNDGKADRVDCLVARAGGEICYCCKSALEVVPCKDGTAEKSDEQETSAEDSPENSPSTADIAHVEQLALSIEPEGEPRRTLIVAKSLSICELRAQLQLVASTSLHRSDGSIVDEAPNLTEANIQDGDELHARLACIELHIIHDGRPSRSLLVERSSKVRDLLIKLDLPEVLYTLHLSDGSELPSDALVGATALRHGDGVHVHEASVQLVVELDGGQQKSVEISRCAALAKLREMLQLDASFGFFTSDGCLLSDDLTVLTAGLSQGDHVVVRKVSMVLMLIHGDGPAKCVAVDVRLSVREWLASLNAETGATLQRADGRQLSNDAALETCGLRDGDEVRVRGAHVQLRVVREGMADEHVTVETSLTVRGLCATLKLDPSASLLKVEGGPELDASCRLLDLGLQNGDQVWAYEPKMKLTVVRAGEPEREHFAWRDWSIRELRKSLAIETAFALFREGWALLEESGYVGTCGLRQGDVLYVRKAAVVLVIVREDGSVERVSLGPGLRIGAIRALLGLGANATLHLADGAELSDDDAVLGALGLCDGDELLVRDASLAAALVRVGAGADAVDENASDIHTVQPEIVSGASDMHTVQPHIASGDSAEDLDENEESSAALSTSAEDGHEVEAEEEATAAEPVCTPQASILSEIAIGTGKALTNHDVPEPEPQPEGQASPSTSRVLRKSPLRASPRARKPASAIDDVALADDTGELRFGMKLPFGSEYSPSQLAWIVRTPTRRELAQVYRGERQGSGPPGVRTSAPHSMRPPPPGPASPARRPAAAAPAPLKQIAHASDTTRAAAREAAHGSPHDAAKGSSRASARESALASVRESVTESVTEFTGEPAKRSTRDLGMESALESAWESARHPTREAGTESALVPGLQGAKCVPSRPSTAGAIYNRMASPPVRFRMDTQSDSYRQREEKQVDAKPTGAVSEVGQISALSTPNTPSTQSTPKGGFSLPNSPGAPVAPGMHAAPNVRPSSASPKSPRVLINRQQREVRTIGAAAVEPLPVPTLRAAWRTHTTPVKVRTQTPPQHSQLGPLTTHIPIAIASSAQPHSPRTLEAAHPLNRPQSPHSPHSPHSPYSPFPPRFPQSIGSPRKPLAQDAVQATQAGQAGQATPTRVARAAASAANPPRARPRSSPAMHEIDALYKSARVDPAEADRRSAWNNLSAKLSISAPRSSALSGYSPQEQEKTKLWEVDQHGSLNATPWKSLK